MLPKSLFGDNIKMVIELRILVDADACPVRHIAEKLAKEFKIEIIFFTDTNHVLKSDYAKIVTVGQGKDAVDLALINQTVSEDIVVTQDYGVAAMALSKKAYAIGNSGLIYSNENIDKLLFERFLAGKVRRAGRKGGKTHNAPKRTEEQDEVFERNLRKLMEN